jgi:recombination protein RecA
MAKKRKKSVDTFNETVVKNLKGFCTSGADFKSPGNIPMGHFLLDFAIQYGMDPNKVSLNSLEGYDPTEPLGLPLGKLVEVFGEEGGGKSSIAYRVAGFAQKMGHHVAWIDTENSFAANLATINGCNKSELIYSNLVNEDNPDINFHAEDVIDNIIKLCVAGVKVIILDSVANLVPKSRAEANAENKFMALLPRLLTDNMGKIVGYAAKHGVLLLFINQLRENLKVTWGDSETSPGGHSLKHNASVRIKISKKNSKDANIYVPDLETGEDRLIGRYANVRIIKNRVAKPFFETMIIPIYYEAYFPDIEERSFDIGRQIRLISVLKGVFKWNDIKITGRTEFIKYIKENDLADDLITDIRQKAVEKDILLPPEIMQYEIKKKKIKKIKDSESEDKK